MTDKHDVTGVWYGRYRSHSDSQENGFIAVLEEAGGLVDGSITEPDDSGGTSIRRASVQGSRNGATLAFVKQYEGPRWHHAVRYSGRIDAEGTAVEGRWAVDWLHGSFVMQREKFDAAELEEAEEAELTVRQGR